jgi:hypothetical protein
MQEDTVCMKHGRGWYVHLRVLLMASCRFCSDVRWYSMGAHCTTHSSQGSAVRH